MKEHRIDGRSADGIELVAEEKTGHRSPWCSDAWLVTGSIVWLKLLLIGVKEDVCHEKEGAESKAVWCGAPVDPFIVAVTAPTKSDSTLGVCFRPTRGSSPAVQVRFRPRLHVSSRCLGPDQG